MQKLHTFNFCGLGKQKNTIIYFPLRQNEPLRNYYTYDGIFGYASEKAFGDVVFFKHSSNFSISDRKEIKQSMKYVKGINRVFDADINRAYKDYMDLYKKFSTTDAAYKERNRFIHFNKFETFFMAGNRISFINLFIDLKELLECPIEDNFRNGKGLDYVQFLQKTKKYMAKIGEAAIGQDIRLLYDDNFFYINDC